MTERFPGSGDARDETNDEMPHMIHMLGTGPNVFVPAGGGDVISLDLVTKMERMKEATVRTDILCAGDVIRLSCENPDDVTLNHLTFEIEKAEWHDLYLNSNAPSKSHTGKVRGKDVPSAIADTPVRLIGSGFGGSMVGLGALVTSRYAYFAVLDEKYRGNEWHSQKIADIEIMRKNADGELQTIEPNQLEHGAYREKPSHNERLQQAAMIMNLLGFDGDYADPTERTPSGDREVRMVGDFVANFSADDYYGNKLQLLNTSTRKVTEINYYASEDTLKIGQYSVSTDEWYDGKVLRSGTILFTSCDTPLNEDKVCYTTSNRYGLETVHIMVCDVKGNLRLEMPALRIGQPSANITLFGDGTHAIEGDYYAKHLAEADPSVIDRMKEKIHITYDENGKPLVMVGSTSVDVRDPSELLNEIIDELIPLSL
jgi:hypothetical protein